MPLALSRYALSDMCGMWLAGGWRRVSLPAAPVPSRPSVSARGRRAGRIRWSGSRACREQRPTLRDRRAGLFTGSPIVTSPRSDAVSWSSRSARARTWCARFGPEYARRLRRQAPRPGDRRHFDEVFIKVGGVRQYLWRAVDQHGTVLDVLIQSKRDGNAATRFFRILLKHQCHPPRVLVTDKLRSYQVAHRTTMSTVEHRQNKYLNNRSENSHQPTRQRERGMKGSSLSVQRNGFWPLTVASPRTSAHRGTV